MPLLVDLIQNRRLRQLIVFAVAFIPAAAPTMTVIDKMRKDVVRNDVDEVKSLT